MKINKKARIAGIGLVSLAMLAGAAASVASATPQTNGSDGAVYVYDTDIQPIADSHVWAWNDDIFGASSSTDVNGEFTCPAQSTNVYAILTGVGTEREGTDGWKAYAPLGFNGATKNVLNAFLMPESVINGGQAAAKAAGGNYSLGLACTIDNGVNVVGAFYRTISVTPVTGAFTFLPQGEVPPTTPPATLDPSTTGSVALAPSTVGAVDGVLSLSVPAGAAATFGTPTLVNNKSTTTGTLGAVTVNDGRVITRKGWDLTANVADFTNAADVTSVISKTQLGFLPQITSTQATGVTAASAQHAGTASYPAAFASGAAANQVGTTVLDAGLTFVAPSDKAAGTYNSTMTITVVSK